MTDAALQSLPPPGAPATAWLGHTLDGRYRILHLLGEGGMGAVFTAEQVNLRTQVAVKMIHPEYTDNAEIAERFRREAMATAKIDHPNVVRAIDFGNLPGGGTYLVTQLVRGPSLTDAIVEGKMPWQKVCDIGAQIADALTAAHAAGIVHRDLKPDNILLEPRDDGAMVKVLDFGIARVADTNVGTQPLTRLGAVIGTPGYMSPEQGTGEVADFRTDLYALGVILWECLAGRELWDGGELSDILIRQLAQAPPSLLPELPGLPPELDRLILHLLAREAAQRPQSAREVRDALRALAYSAPPASAPPQSVAPAQGPGPAQAQALSLPPAPGQRSQAGGFIAVFAGLALLIIAMWAVQNCKGGEAPPAGDAPAKSAP